MEQEKFLGGSFYYFLIRHGTYSRIYGIFATSDRIVGVRPRPLPWLLSPILVLVTIAVVAFLFQGLVQLTHIASLRVGILPVIVGLFWYEWKSGWLYPGPKNITSVADLDARKSFEIPRREISRIEMEKTGTLTSGHFRIITTTGKDENFSIGPKFQDYNGLRNLVREFCSIPPQIQFSDQT